MTSLERVLALKAPVVGSSNPYAFAPAVERADAAARLERSRFRHLLGRRNDPTARLELVHLPYRQASVTVRYAEATTERSGELSCLVCANTGLASRFDPAAHAVSADETSPLPSRIDAAELDRRALELLRRLAATLGRPRLLRLEGQPRAVDRAYPIWLAILQRGSRLDVSGVDALTGQRIGSATRQALLLALSSPASEL